MAYKKLLKQLIEERNYSNKYIADECKKIGEPMDASYISKLINENEDVVASEKKNEALAKVLGVNKSLLNIEAYLDKAPKEIKDFMDYLKSGILKTFLFAFENSITQEEFEVLKNKMTDMPLANFIVEANNIKDNIGTFKNNNAIIESMNFNDDVIKFQLSNNIGLPITDTSMEPVIYKGSSIILEILPEYNSGDILCVKLRNSTEHLVRTCIFTDNTIILQPFNLQEFKPIEIDKNDVTILGKVKKVTKELY